MDVFILFLLSLSVALMSFIGLIFSFGKTRVFFETHKQDILFFSGGVLTATSYILIRESLEHNQLGAGIGWLAVGAGITFILTSLIPVFHHHSAHTEHKHEHEPHSGSSILIGDALHNLGDGILLGSTFGIGGIAKTLSILPQLMIHEAIQEISDYTILVQNGFEKGKALVWNFVSSLTVIVGALGTYYFLERFESWESIILSIAAGSFLFILWQDVIPMLRRSNPLTIRSILLYVSGIAIIIGVSQLGDHSHSHEETQTMFNINPVYSRVQKL